MDPSVIIVEELQTNSVFCLQHCIQLLKEEEGSAELVLPRVESIISAFEAARQWTYMTWSSLIIEKLTEVVNTFLMALEFTDSLTKPGRPVIDVSRIEYFLCMNFKATEIAKMFGTSRATISRRLNENENSVRKSYSTITEGELSSAVISVLMNHPNTGYKRMKGFLLEMKIKVTDIRVREVMRLVDPMGVYQRTLQNRAIVRLQYFVKYSNQMWHLDANLKLIRWGIVIRCGIDGKSRPATYLEASGDNRADTHLMQFIRGVAIYGIPYRTRTDKGGENKLVARFMIEKGGTEKASHICGRSVHNHRIERFRRDVFYGCTGFYYNLFTKLEVDQILNVDNPTHLHLRLIFLPRMNTHLSSFMKGWHHHPLSTENNYSPQQLMLIHLSPADYDMSQDEVDIEDAECICNTLTDLDRFSEAEEDTLTTPVNQTVQFTAAQLEYLGTINPLQESNMFGYDIFCHAIQGMSCLPSS